MKKIIYIIFAIAFLPAFSQAPRGFYATAGLTQTSLKSDDLLSDPGIGFKTGIIGSWGYHETYNFQLEFLYNQKSFDLKSVEGDYQTVNSVKFNSEAIDFGFYFNYYILKPEEDAFFIGPQLGFTTSFSGEFIPAGNGETYNNRYLPYLIDDNSFRNMSPISLDAGFGLTGGYNDFRFDLRYTMGLSNRLESVETNSRDDSNLYTGPILEGKLNTISFSLSYLFWKKNNKR
ncbi:PorT family protein [Flavobacterium sp. N3904]|uniref:PorT family protein n=1 Tax=Flavobacterium sp. N3904 TaxID=2986835 RepID=UPI00222529C6|nr:PorT family protein [Flavobacterium sp. N3904]